MKYKKNHYVPEFYLRYFSAVHTGDRKALLWVYDKEGNEPRKQSPKHTAAINDLYKVSALGIPSNALETTFSDQENLVSPILSKWREPGVIPKIPEIKEVAYFLALLHLRNPKTAKWVEAVAQLILQERAKALARNSVQFTKFWETLVGEKLPPPELTKERFREMVLNFEEHFITKIDPKYATLSPLQYANAVYDELKQFYWCLCSAPSGWNFITCDSPVVVRFRKGDGIAFGNGFGHPTAQVIFPVSPTVCLYLSRTFRNKVVLVNSVFVKNANRRTAINAERYIFASQISDGFEKLAKKYSFTRKQPRLDEDEMVENMRTKAMHQKSPLAE